MTSAGKTPQYQALSASISALALFWETRLAEKSLRTKLGLDEAQWAADDKNDSEPLSVSLINNLVVKEGGKTRNLTDAEMALLKTSLKPFTPFADSWLSIDITQPILISAIKLFESFLNDICIQFKAKTTDLAGIQNWDGWKSKLFEYGVLTESNLARGLDEKVGSIFEMNVAVSDVSEGMVTDALKTINDMTTLIIRSSGWKLMTRIQP